MGKDGIAQFEVLFKNWQWVKQSKVLFKDNGGTVPDLISFVHGKEEGGMWVGGGSEFDRSALDSFPEVSEADIVRGDKFTQVPSHENNAGKQKIVMQR